MVTGFTETFTRKHTMEFLPDGSIFGLMDNGIMIFCAWSGLEIEKALPQRLQVGLGALFGAGIGNTISDAAGALLDPAMVDMVGGITLGCILPMAIIPALPVITKWLKSLRNSAA